MKLQKISLSYNYDQSEIKSIRGIMRVFEPQNLDELSSFLRDQSQRRNPVIPVGGNTSKHCGEPDWLINHQAKTGTSTYLSLKKNHSSIEYSPRDLVISLGAQTTFSELQRILREHQQTIPIDVQFPEQAQLGGIISANEYGDRAVSTGTWRDFILGMTVLTGTGEIIKVGGKVVKNVAGYDVNKLMIGSLGQLSIITDISLKVTPCVESVRHFQVHLDPVLSQTQGIRLWHDLLRLNLPLSSLNLNLKQQASQTELQLKCSISGKTVDVNDTLRRLRSFIKNSPFMDAETMETVSDETVINEKCHQDYSTDTSGSEFLLYAPPASLMDLILEHKKLPVPQNQVELKASAIGRIRLHIPAKSQYSFSMLNQISKRYNAVCVADFISPNHRNQIERAGFVYHHPSQTQLIHRIKKVFDPSGILNRGRYFTW